MAPKALVLVADGSEEMETTTPYDCFVRAGFDTTLAYVPAASTAADKPLADKPIVKLSRGLQVQTDKVFTSLASDELWDVLVIPGGVAGAKTLSENKRVQSMIKSHYDSGNKVGMICAGSLAALTSGIAKGGKLTSHPSVKDQLDKDYDYSEERVVVFRNLITSRGPGTAFLFALTLVEEVAGKKKRDEIAAPMLPSEKL